MQKKPKLKVFVLTNYMGTHFCWRNIKQRKIKVWNKSDRTRNT